MDGQTPRVGRRLSVLASAGCPFARPSAHLVICQTGELGERAVRDLTEPDGDDACVGTVCSDDAAMVAKYLAWWDAPFEVPGSPELLAPVRGSGPALRRRVAPFLARAWLSLIHI